MNNITYIDSHKKRREKLLIPRSARVAIDVLGIPEPKNLVAFSLVRRKRGTEIFIHFDSGLSVNFSLIQNIYPKNFNEARLYIKEFQKRFNCNLHEKKRYGFSK